MKRLLFLLSLTLLLGGCSGLRLVESQVRATAAIPTGGAAIEAGARYRFERLPSQTDPVETDTVEAIAEAELTEVGLVRDDKNPRYSVQITTRMESFYVDDWGRPYSGPRVGGSIMIGTGNLGIGIGTGVGMRFPPPSQYRHEATLLLRDLQNNQVVYETSALHEGPWNDRYNILRAVLAAALKDFPDPPAGARRVKVEIPR
ncbi:DUF4136 domain-containing protein [Rhodoferax sp. BAB1]|uniref:DUF4136 domain-containing protein n=1 Tax=Rhodoferax sp. BAB1 TaxID=2741720 RepID=UPI001577342D|nr:DUF4136 domain-containing protein [Rhodoferax sp. BAB1]QKO20509.1 DUF4136 domain-containing protein [Rhodoferax sp. BAB1]